MHSLFDRLKAACPEDWSAFVDHAFVRGLADGTLPPPVFRAYLIQDYQFLINVISIEDNLSFSQV